MFVCCLRECCMSVCLLSECCMLPQGVLYVCLSPQGVQYVCLSPQGVLYVCTVCMYVCLLAMCVHFQDMWKVLNSSLRSSKFTFSLPPSLPSLLPPLEMVRWGLWCVHSHLVPVAMTWLVCSGASTWRRWGRVSLRSETTSTPSQ